MDILDPVRTLGSSPRQQQLAESGKGNFSQIPEPAIQGVPPGKIYFARLQAREPSIKPFVNSFHFISILTVFLIAVSNIKIPQVLLLY